MKAGFPSILECHGKSWNLRKEFSRRGKSWKITVVMEKSWNFANKSWNFLTEG